MSVNSGTDFFKVSLAEELLERAVRLVSPADVGKSFCTDTLGMFNKLVNFLTCICFSTVLYIDCTYRTALIYSVSE